MAASDNTYPQRASSSAHECLGTDALGERLEEEVGRAERHRTALSCLAVSVEDLRTIERTHGRALSEQALAYLGVALRREFRRFDRVGRLSEREFVVVLPGADGMRGEIVARRALARLRAIKLEARGRRRALHVAVGIATWRDGMSAAQLLASARVASAEEPTRDTVAPGEEPAKDTVAPGEVPTRGPVAPGEERTRNPVAPGDAPAVDTPLPSGPLSFTDALRL